MAQRKTAQLHFKKLHRYLSGVTFLCTLVAMIASAIAGAAVDEIAFRGLVVVAALGFLSSIIVNTWVSIETSTSGRKLATTANRIVSNAVLLALCIAALSFTVSGAGIDELGIKGLVFIGVLVVLQRIVFRKK